MRNTKRFNFTAILAALLAAPPLAAATFVPVVRWNGTEFHVMNGSGVYDLQPVDYPIVDVPFSNPTSLAVWTDGSDDYVYVVDSNHDRVQLFSNNVEYVKHATTGGDVALTYNAAAGAGQFSATVINLNVSGNPVRGSEEVIIDDVEYTRVSSLIGYSAGDPYYTITWEAANAAAAGLITTPGTLTSSSEIVVKIAQCLPLLPTFGSDSLLLGDIDFLKASAAVNGTVIGQVFEINEIIPNNTGHPTSFTNLVSIECNLRTAGKDSVDVYLLDSTGTSEALLHAFAVESDAGALFKWVSTYDSPMSEPNDVAFAESGANVLGVYHYTATVPPTVPPSTPPAMTVINNAMFSGHDYRVTVTHGQQTTGVNIRYLAFYITDIATGNIIAQYEQTTATGAGPVYFNIIPGVSFIITTNAGMNIQAGCVMTFDLAGGTLPVNRDYLFIADTGNDRIKVVKGADNGAAATNGTDTNYFGQDTLHQDYYGRVTVAAPSMTFVSAVTAMEGTYAVYTTNNLGSPMQTAWTKVDNFESSGPTDKHFTYDYKTKVLQFGNGVQGAIPNVNLWIFAYYTPTLDVLQFGTTGASTGNFNAPQGIDARWNAAQGWYDVYVSDTGNDRVVKLKFNPPAGGSQATMEWVTSWTASYPGGTLDEPTDLQVISDGVVGANDEVSLFVCDTGNDRVIVYRDAAAENEGDGGTTAPVFTALIGGSGTDLGEFSRPSGISVMQEYNRLKVYVADSDSNFITKFMLGDEPDVEIDWGIDSYGYLPTGSYTFSKLAAWTTMARDYPDGAYIKFYYSDTTAAGQANPSLCSSSTYSASTTEEFVWNFTSTPGGTPDDGIYYLYAKLYDSLGILLDTDSSIGETISTLTIDSDLSNGIGAFDAKDGDKYIYLQNGSLSQFNLTAIYPDSVTAVSYCGTFPADKMQIVRISEGPAWQTVHHLNTLFESNYNNTTGTFTVSSAVLGSSTGLVSGPPVYKIAIILVQIDDDAISTSNRVYKGKVEITAGGWTDYKGSSLSSPNLNDLELKFGYIGDIADSTGAGWASSPT